MKKASEKLALILGNVPCINVFYADDWKPYKQVKGASAWLVGHGLSNGSVIGTKVEKDVKSLSDE